MNFNRACVLSAIKTKQTYSSQSLGGAQVCTWLILVEPSWVVQLHEEAKINYRVRTCWQVKEM